MKILLKGFLVISMIFSLNVSVFANSQTPTFEKNLVNGVGNVSVYLDYNSGIGFWESFIVTAVNNWMYTGWANPIYMNFVSSNVGSTIDVFRQEKSYWESSGNYGVLAQTKFYRSGGTIINPNNENWKYAEIHINHDEFRKPSFSNDQATGTIIHEFGHAFGLAHNNSNVNSIMCQTSFGRVVQRVQKVDNDAILSKY